MNVIFLICLALSSPEVAMTEGEGFMRAEKWQEASDKFNEVIGSWQLNSAGSSMIYWNIYIAELKLNHEDKSINALLGFIVYGIDAYKSSQPFLINWSRRFKVREKLMFADAMIQAVWAKRNNYTCRSEAFKCHLFEEELVILFKHEIPFCGILKNVLIITKTREEKILKVNVECKLGSAETYYFVVSDEL